MARVLATSRAAATAVLRVSHHLDPSLIAALEGAKAQASNAVDELPLDLALDEIATSWESLARHIARQLAVALGTTTTTVQPPSEADAQIERMSQLCASPLFEHLSLDTLAGLAAVATPREFAPGELICKRGAPSDGVLVVVGGAAQILIKTEVGTVPGLVEAGQTIGELGAMTGATWSDTAVATHHGTSVLCLPAEPFRGFLEHDAHAASGMLRLVSERLREARNGGSPLGRPTPTSGPGSGSAPN